MTSLRSRLCFEVPLVLEGFQGRVRRGEVSALSFAAMGADTWFNAFVGDLVDSIGRRHKPVYRMADGEFIFAVGQRAALPVRGEELRGLAVWAMRTASAQLGRMRERRKGVQTCWGERYRGAELRALRRSYASQLREIGHQGYLAMHFTRSPGRFAEQFINPVCAWFECNCINLSPDNYVPFYFVYAALRGPARERLLEARRVLIVTGASEQKRRLLLRGLEREGVADGEIYSISPTAAMRETLDLGRLRIVPEVVLVGAGIGASNVLAQLEPLRTVCLDAGACVECLAHPEKATRIFLVADSETGVPG